MSNTEDKIINNQQFYGGMAADAAIGPASSFGYGQALDHRSNPSQLTVQPGPRRIDSNTVTDLILNMAQVRSGVRYAFGNTGKVYKIDTDNTVGLVDTLPTGTDGMLYRSDVEAVFFATKRDIRRLSLLPTTPTFDVTLGPSKSTDSKSYQSGGTKSYSVPSTIDEGKKCSFQPDIEPFYSIKVAVTDKGTGDWKLTLHDGLNTKMAEVTILAADMQVGMMEFKFTKQIRALVKPNARTYHFHLTSSDGTGTVSVATANELSTADYELWADRLVDTVSGFHPMAQFLQYTLIGNGNYLAVWEPLSDSDPPNNEFLRHRLTFPSGFEVIGVTPTDEFTAIAIAKYADDDSKDFQEGKIIIWDGVAQTYNQIIDVAGGAPESINTHENLPYFLVDGVLTCWPGGKNTVKVRRMPNTDTHYKEVVDATRVYPNMLTVRSNLLHVGFPSVTNNPTVEHGVYSWGSLDKDYPPSFGYDYLISTQRQLIGDTPLQLGCIRNFGDEMYISWQDGEKFGLDIVDAFCKPAPVFKYRNRRFDAGAAYKEKKALRNGLYTAALPEGTTIVPTYQIDEEAEVVQSEFLMKEGDTIRECAINNGDFRRIIHGFNGTCESDSSPVIYASALQWNPYMERRSMNGDQ